MCELVVVAADVDAHEAGDDFADDTSVRVTANQIIVELRVKWQLMHQVFHSRVEAVMARLMAVQENVRDMMRTKYRRDAGLHLRFDHIDLIGVEIHIPGYDLTNAPVLPAVPFIHPLVFPDTHRAVKEQGAANKIHPSELDCTDQV